MDRKVDKISFPTGWEVEDIFDANLDINIISTEGEVFFVCLFTLKNIEKLMLHGETVAFWADDLIIVPDLSLNTIRLAADEVVENGLGTFIGNIEKVFGVPPIYGEILEGLKGNPLERD